MLYVQTRIPPGRVTYEEAAKPLCSGQVKTAGQNHRHMVELELKNGTSVWADEPPGGNIFQECSNCKDVCNGITFWIE